MSDIADDDEVTRAHALAKIGRQLGADELARSEALWKDAVAARAGSAAREVLDLAYGDHPRQRLDLYAPDAAPPARGGRPIVLFVPGGGFTGGDKRKPGSPFNGNVGRWAAMQGWVGIVMNYRLAPEFAWPSAAEDLGDALAWVQQHAFAHGGDPARLVLVGHSAGAAHVASYLAHRAPRGHRRLGARAAVLLSGIYDIPAMGDRPSVRSYYGDDARMHGERSCVVGLCEQDLPLFVAVAAEDPDGFHAQALTLLTHLQVRRGRLPDFMVVQAHNHYTETLHLGSGTGELSPALARFIRRHTDGPRARA
ncbi:MAG: alpha/beta hydrolase [Variovorax sp.]|nr:alpha/beta hydrolase [Variovorax sp.]